VLRKAARLAEEHIDTLVEWLVRESGSTRLKAGFEAKVTIKALHEAAALPSRSTGEILPSEPGRLNLARRRPLGVVGVISPFNFPLYLAMRAVAPAIALGNAVVLKPDPRTAVCGGAVIARLFEQAGLPAGVLHMLPGDGAAGAALTSDPHVAMIQFTGSTAAGRKVGEAAGKHLKKVSLELGGKNSLIILDDADLDLAVANTAWGVYLHQGQICMATGRVLVWRLQWLVEDLLERQAAYRPDGRLCRPLAARGRRAAGSPRCPPPRPRAENSRLRQAPPRLRSRSRPPPASEATFCRSARRRARPVPRPPAACPQTTPRRAEGAPPRHGARPTPSRAERRE
jgi:acyl-CoA reductase-like NAD-dependent aldehyde dehydrogenase